MKTILVTGGGGFIGSNLVAALIQRGDYRIVVCDTFGDGDKWRNLCRYSVAEIIPPQELFPWLEKNTVELIYHLGAVSSTTEKNIDFILENNFTLSVRLWRWCNAHHIRLIYTSSSATYGNAVEGFEDSLDMDYLQTLIPLSGYGWSKHLFDTHVAKQLHQREVALPQWAGLKVFNTYGPNEYHKGSQRSVITQICEQAIHVGLVRLFRSYRHDCADGAQMRDVIYVKDCVQVLLWFLDHPDVNGLFNLGTGKARSFSDMAHAVFEALGREPRLQYIDMPPALVPHYQYFTEAKMERLHAAGYTAPFTSLEDGIRDYVANYLCQDNPYN